MYTKITHITYVDGVVTLYNKRDQDLATKSIPGLTQEGLNSLVSSYMNKNIDDLDVDLTGWVVNDLGYI